MYSWLFTALGAEGVTVLPPLHHHMKRFSGLYTGPYFDPSTTTNITTQLGTHAYLPCKVKQLGNKSVSIQSQSLCPFRFIYIFTQLNSGYLYFKIRPFLFFIVLDLVSWIIPSPGFYRCLVSFGSSGKIRFDSSKTERDVTEPVFSGQVDSPVDLSSDYPCLKYLY